MTSLGTFFLWKYMSGEDKREELRKMILTGKSKHYLGREVKDVTTLSEEDVDRYYEIYSCILTNELAETLSDTVIGAVATVGCTILGVTDRDAVEQDLQKDKFTGALVKKVCGSIFDKFGYFVAPVTIGSIFLKHKIKQTRDEGEEVVSRVIDEVLNEELQQR